MNRLAIGLLSLLLLVPVLAQSALGQAEVPSDLVFSTTISDEVKQELKTLYAGDDAAKLQAMDKLGELGPDAAIGMPFLVDVVGGDISETLREKILDTLSKLGDPAVEPLLGLLSNGSVILRENAASILGSMKAAAAVEPLQQSALHDESETVRQAALDALTQFGDVDAISMLKTVAEDAAQAPEIRGRAIRALGRMRLPETAEPLIALLEDSAGDIRLRCAAAGALGELKASNPDVIDPLLDALKDKKTPVKIWAAWALHGSVDPRCVKPLSDLLKDDDVRVRLRAADALALTEDPKAVTALVGALKDEDAEVRVWAAVGLAGFADPKAVKPLGDVLRDSDIRVRLRAVDALGRIKDAEATGLLASVLADRRSDSAVRAEAARALGQSGDRRALGPLLGALGDSDVMVRCWAANALGRIRGPQAVDGLVRALEDRDPKVRGWAATALGRIGDPGTVDALKKVAADQDESAKAKALHALQRMGVSP